MGGNLFSERRINTDELNIIRDEVLTKLNKVGIGKIPRTFTQKLDHGDLDIILPFPQITKDELAELFTIDIIKDISVNSNITSFRYKKFQIDLCYYMPNEIESVYNYMCFGDTSNIVGVLATQAIGMRYTHRGLICPIRLKREDTVGDVIISTDVAKIMSFLDLDYTPWKEGFNTELEVFEWVTCSKFFNKEFFAFENLNHINATRNRKRLMYSRFVDWCKDITFRNHHIPDDNKTDHIWRSVVHFDFFWLNAAKPILDERIQSMKAAEKWNASDIIRLTGLEFKALGDCVGAFKDYTKMFDISYSAFIVNRRKVNIEEIFNKWYRHIYERKVI